MHSSSFCVPRQEQRWSHESKALFKSVAWTDIPSAKQSETRSLQKDIGCGSYCDRYCVWEVARRRSGAEGDDRNPHDRARRGVANNTANVGEREPEFAVQRCCDQCEQAAGKPDAERR